MRNTRKRKRISSDTLESQEHHGEIDAAANSKEVDVWEAFREEYVESVEQLPLSLHRNFSLLREIDGQAHALELMLSPKIRDYIRRRQAISAPQETRHEDGVQSTRSSPRRTNSAAAISSQLFPDARENVDHVPSGKMLSDVSAILNELLSACEEKVNIAQATYDSVDRHVRLLDQAIRDQESQAKNQVYVPRSTSPPPPVSGSVPKPQDGSISVVNDTSSKSKSKKDKNSRNRSSTRSRRPTNANASPTADVDMAEGALQTEPISGTDTATSVVLSSVDMPIDPNEPRYCYCGGVSYGEMIGCDAPGCEREWFHLGCVGLSEAPKRGKWYCDVCKEKNVSGSRKRPQRLLVGPA